MNAAICVRQLAELATLATKRVLAVKSNLAIYHLVKFVAGMWLWLALPLRHASSLHSLTHPAGNLIFNESI